MDLPGNGVTVHIEDSGEGLAWFLLWQVGTWLRHTGASLAAPGYLPVKELVGRARSTSEVPGAWCSPTAVALG